MRHDMQPPPEEVVAKHPQVIGVGIRRDWPLQTTGWNSGNEYHDCRGIWGNEEWRLRRHVYIIRCAGCKKLSAHDTPTAKWCRLSCSANYRNRRKAKIAACFKPENASEVWKEDFCG